MQPAVLRHLLLRNTKRKKKPSVFYPQPPQLQLLVFSPHRPRCSDPLSSNILNQMLGNNTTAAIIFPFSFLHIQVSSGSGLAVCYRANRGGASPFTAETAQHAERRAGQAGNTKPPSPQEKNPPFDDRSMLCSSEPKSYVRNQGSLMGKQAPSSHGSEPPVTGRRLRPSNSCIIANRSMQHRRGRHRRGGLMREIAAVGLCTTANFPSLFFSANPP